MHGRYIGIGPKKAISVNLSNIGAWMQVVLTQELSFNKDLQQ